MVVSVGQNLSSTLVLEQEGAPAELMVSYRSKCKDNQAANEWREKGECQGIKHEKITFQVRLNATACLKEPQIFRIKMQGISEEVKITVDTECQCDCGAAEKSSEHCNHKGDLSCGMCSCDEGYLGQNCSCVQRSDTIKMLDFCRPDNRSLVCSGQGSCECGNCVCRNKYRGKYCQCDPDSCEKHNGVECNGKGNCTCGKCECEDQYTGSACECSPSQDECKNESSLCGGQGECVCNRCHCKPGVMGDYCSAFIDACKLFKDCLACHLEGSGSCHERCFNATVKHLEGTHELSCIYKHVSYSVELKASGEVNVKYADLPHTVDKTAVIIGSSVSGIIITGIIIIIIYRLLLELYDYREYQSFVKMQNQTQWKEAQNPLFKGATTTVMNPLHMQNEA